MTPGLERDEYRFRLFFRLVMLVLFFLCDVKTSVLVGFACGSSNIFIANRVNFIFIFSRSQPSHRTSRANPHSLRFFSRIFVIKMIAYPFDKYTNFTSTTSMQMWKVAFSSPRMCRFCANEVLSACVHVYVCDYGSKSVFITALKSVISRLVIGIVAIALIQRYFAYKYSYRQKSCCYALFYIIVWCVQTTTAGATQQMNEKREKHHVIHSHKKLFERQMCRSCYASD